MSTWLGRKGIKTVSIIATISVLLHLYFSFARSNCFSWLNYSRIWESFQGKFCLWLNEAIKHCMWKRSLFVINWHLNSATSVSKADGLLAMSVSGSWWWGIFHIQLDLLVPPWFQTCLPSASLLITVWVCVNVLTINIIETGVEKCTCPHICDPRFLLHTLLNWNGVLGLIWACSVKCTSEVLLMLRCHGNRALLLGNVPWTHPLIHSSFNHVLDQIGLQCGSLNGSFWSPQIEEWTLFRAQKNIVM